MTITPIHPDDAKPVASDRPTTSLLFSRRTLGFRKYGSRRTLGIRKYGSRRVLGRRMPSRRTLMPRTRL